MARLVTYHGKPAHEKDAIGLEGFGAWAVDEVKLFDAEVAKRFNFESANDFAEYFCHIYNANQPYKLFTSEPAPKDGASKPAAAKSAKPKAASKPKAPAKAKAKAPAPAKAKPAAKTPEPVKSEPTPVAIESPPPVEPSPSDTPATPAQE